MNPHVAGAHAGYAACCGHPSRRPLRCCLPVHVLAGLAWAHRQIDPIKQVTLQHVATESRIMRAEAAKVVQSEDLSITKGNFAPGHRLAEGRKDPIRGVPGGKTHPQARVEAKAVAPKAGDAGNPCCF